MKTNPIRGRGTREARETRYTKFNGEYKARFKRGCQCKYCIEKMK